MFFLEFLEILKHRFIYNNHAMLTFFIFSNDKLFFKRSLIIDKKKYGNWHNALIYFNILKHQNINHFTQFEHAKLITMRKMFETKYYIYFTERLIVNFFYYSWSNKKNLLHEKIMFHNFNELVKCNLVNKSKPKSIYIPLYISDLVYLHIWATYMIVHAIILIISFLGYYSCRNNNMIFISFTKIFFISIFQTFKFQTLFLDQTPWFRTHHHFLCLIIIIHWIL